MQHPFPPWTLMLSGRPGPSCQSQDSLLPGAPAALHHPVCRPGEVCVCDLAACRTRMATCIGLPSLQQAQTQKRVSQDGEGGIFQHALVTPQEFPGAVRPAPVQGLQLPSHKLVPPAVASRVRGCPRFPGSPDSWGRDAAVGSADMDTSCLLF